MRVIGSEVRDGARVHGGHDGGGTVQHGVLAGEHELPRGGDTEHARGAGGGAPCFNQMIHHNSWWALVSMNRACFMRYWHPGLKAGAASLARAGAEVQPLTGPDWAVPSRTAAERKGADDAELETHPTLNNAVRARQGADFRY